MRIHKWIYDNLRPELSQVIENIQFYSKDPVFLFINENALKSLKCSHLCYFLPHASTVLCSKEESLLERTIRAENSAIHKKSLKEMLQEEASNAAESLCSAGSSNVLVIYLQKQWVLLNSLMFFSFQHSNMMKHMRPWIEKMNTSVEKALILRHSNPLKDKEKRKKQYTLLNAYFYCFWL